MALRFDRYETLQPIASGGMATVYLGKVLGEGGFERRVAIKVMHKHIADDPQFVAMFLDEARLAARIHHPNVVSTLDVQRGNDGMFLVMEYVEGCSLRRLLQQVKRRDQRLPLPIALRIAIDALAGLHAAHELRGPGDTVLNLVHRDVSPHNILVGTDGMTRLTDFGVARAEARLQSTQSGTLKGKLPYMAPEQARDNNVDRRADVYAAAVVLWEMLVGRRLFKAESEIQLALMILDGVSRSPAEVTGDVPAEINAACMKALALKPTDRQATAADFAEELEKAAQAAGVQIAGTRQVARLAEQFKVDVHSLPPKIEDPESATYASTGPIARRPSPKEAGLTSHSSLDAAAAAIIKSERKPKKVALAATVGVTLGAGALLLVMQSLWSNAGGVNTDPVAASPGSAHASGDVLDRGEPPASLPAATGGADSAGDENTAGGGSTASAATASASASSTRQPKTTPRHPHVRPVGSKRKSPRILDFDPSGL